MGLCMSETIGLRKLAKNQLAIVRRVAAEGELGKRIREMGLIPGVEIRVTGRAPLRDPVAVRLRDFTLTLRNSEADFILVEPLSEDGR